MAGVAMAKKVVVKHLRPDRLGQAVSHGCRPTGGHDLGAGPRMRHTASLLQSVRMPSEAPKQRMDIEKAGDND